ncbi:Bug family tripartite tricarboxylate transporter substrate binding protein [Marinobacter sp. JSM 1782161]|uniref:Bug family tripartite tricarboxylate transporter substrate binding protein n=1 Tax=Marinobacter sp. JSM 1782161 TaxID=2685906 RepID=UPI0014037664|nr:tripartite tricarboxylate transporter substrate binding protein [Marinobacter sp. JSM 1782161]
MKKTIIALSVALASATVPALVQADDGYPEKNIEFIVPYGPGGGSDTFVRSIQPALEDALGGTLVVRNISGGGGAVGYSRAVTSRPDGYTVTTPNNANFTLEGLGNVGFSYNDFEYIARVTVMPYVLAVRDNDQWTDFESLKEDLQASGDKLSVGFSGVGSSTHVTSVALGRELGMDFQFIPFDGGSAAVSAAMGGHVDAVVLNPSEIMSAVESGKLTAIVSTGGERSSAMPEVPTMKELGFDMELNQWRGIAAPKGLDPAIEEQWVTAIKKAVQDPQFRQAAKNGGTDIKPLYGDELDAFIKDNAELMIPIAESVKQ